jgi:hypothetical protein
LAARAASVVMATALSFRGDDMIYLASTSDKLQVVTSSANALHVHATFTDLSGTTVAPGRTDTSISAATTTDVVASPGLSTTRKIKFLSLFNDHATAAHDIVIRHTDGTTAVDLWAGSVPAQTGLTFAEKGGWRVSVPFPSAEIQTFDAPGGTWNKPTGPRTGLTLIRLWGAGGGGGGGASLATAVVAKGGSGGGGGLCISQIFPTDELPDQLRVVIGFGGAGGVGGAAGAAGGNANAGGSSFVRSPAMILMTAFGGSSGAGGATSAVNLAGGNGAGIHGSSGGAAGPAASGQPNSGSTSSTLGPSWEGGGGGGGSNATTPVPLTTQGGNARFGGAGGGSGGCHSSVPDIVNATAGGGTGNSVGVTAGGLGGAAGTSGASPTAGANGIDTTGIVGGTGGGGGGTTVTASTAGANGGNGGKGGGGGGGGGVGMNPGVGGNGGNGGNGFGWIATW